MKTICMLSDMHPLFDDRIYWKEAISLKNHGYNLIHIGFDKKARDFISQEGIRIIAIKKRVFSNNIFVHKLIKILSFDDPHRAMMKKIVEVRADAYHIHDLKVNKLGNRIRKLPWKPKIIYDIHEDYGDIIRYYHQKKRIKKLVLFAYAFWIDFLEKKRTKNYDYYIHVVPQILEKFQQISPAVPSEIIYNFTNLTPLSSRETIEKKYDLIYSGLINRQRGPFEIISAIEIVKKSKPDIKLLFLGRYESKKLEDSVKQMASSKNLEKNILFKDAVSYNNVDEFYKEAKIGLAVFHPIKIFYYSVQIKTFEYMLYGLPLICNNFGNVNKFVTESNSGIPVDPMNPKEIANAIIKLMDDSQLYQQMSSNGIKAAQTRYNWKSEEIKLVNLYKNLLSVEH